MQRNKKLIKINEMGEFETFPGVTIISTVHSNSTSFLEAMHKRLSANLLITKYYSLLPPDSFHMTVNNLYVAKDHPNWINFVSDNLSFFKNLNFFLAKDKDNFQVKISQTVFIGGVIQLILMMPTDLKNKFKHSSCMFNIQDKIPNEFHITLGYNFREIPPNDRRLIEKIVIEELNKLLAETSDISLNPPALCYFNDMTKFIAWDGQQNPFLSLSEHSIFSNNNKKRSREETKDEEVADIKEKKFCSENSYNGIR